MPGPIQSIQRAAAVLELLERSPRPLVLKDIVEELRLPKATVHGILRTLVDLEYAEQDHAGAAYIIGARHSGGVSALDGNVLRSAGIRWCDTLASLVGMQVLLAVTHEGGAASEHAVVQQNWGTLRNRGAGHNRGVLEDRMDQQNEAVVVHHVFRPDDSPQRLRVGETLPLHATAAGKLLLAYSRDRDRLLRNLILERYTSATLISRQLLTTEIDGIRGSGLATEVGEFELGTAAFAVPVYGPQPGALGALVVCGPPSALVQACGEPRSIIVEQMRSAAGSITRELRSW